MATKQKYDNFCKALSNLHEGLSLDEPYNIVEQTGIVRLFEICFELSWKMMGALLESHGKAESRMGSSRVVINVACRRGMIAKQEEVVWLEMAKARNSLAHTYSNEKALAVIRSTKSTYIHAFDRLKESVERGWIGTE